MVRRVWVADEFQKKLKKDAADANMSMLKYTDSLARYPYKDKTKKRGKGIEFKLF